MDYLEEVRSRFAQLVEESRLGHSPVQVVGARSLSPEEAIGRPGATGLSPVEGQGVMIQATFRGDLGQAYTDQPGSYQGTLDQVLSLTLDSNFQRAVFLATLNAVLHYLGLVQKTVHCRDQEPEICARELARYIGERFGRPKTAFIGLQPAMVEALAARFPLRVTDLNPDNVGWEKCGVLVEDASRTPEASPPATWSWPPAPRQSTPPCRR